ncbi:MAG: DNA internalization-related competence protein ComEC/Rec2 [Chloroflexi bacterium]|nr:DNA internalization-related competence protein ComEC/Rec2 [Chloroflexota bacterium]
MKLILLSVSWIAGVCLGAWAGYPWVVIPATVAVVLLAFPLRRSQVLLMSLCLVVLLGGILRMQASSYSAAENTVQAYNNSGVVRIKGMVANAPELKGGALVLRLDAGEGKSGETWEKVSGGVLVYALPYLSYRYGDVLEISGKMETPLELEGFDWREYLARQGVHSIIRYPESISLVAGGQGFKLLEWIYGVRTRLAQSLDSALHEPQSALAQAILLGKRSTIPDDLDGAFLRTGTTHIIAISGLNVGIIGGIALGIGVWLFGRRRSTYFWLAVGAIWGYALLTGLEAPVVRAAIMCSIWLFADLVGRQRSAMPALLLAAAIMVGVHPRIAGDVSFQLSFGAMAGLILLTPRFQNLSRRVLRISEERRTWVTLLIDSFAVTLGATLTTLPIIAFYFHQISLVTLFANLFALWVMPAIMVTSALVAVIGLFAPPLAYAPGWVDWLFISYMIEVVEFFSAVPFASVDVSVEPPLVWGYYALLGIVLWLAANRSKLPAFWEEAKARISAVPGLADKIPTKFILFILLIMAALVWVAAVNTQDNRLHIFFFDVGQGEAIFMETPSGQSVLIDGGPADGEILSLLGKRLSFWEKDIDLLILTHPHEDHVGGLVAVLNKYQVGQVLESSIEHESRTYEEWLGLIEEEGARRTAAQTGQHIELGDGIRLEVLQAGGIGFDDDSSIIDNSAVVLRLVYGDFSALLTSDIFTEAEQSLLDSRFHLDSTVLKVAHHGSDTSSCAEFLAEVDPQMAVISVGADNTFGHPSPEVLERLGTCRLYRTDVHGTIELITDGQRLWVKTER